MLSEQGFASDRVDARICYFSGVVEALEWGWGCGFPHTWHCRSESQDPGLKRAITMGPSLSSASHPPYGLIPPLLSAHSGTGSGNCLPRPHVGHPRGSSGAVERGQ